MREAGYYWVKFYSHWQPAEFNMNGYWYFTGYNKSYNESEINKIGDKIEIPEKYKR